MDKKLILIITITILLYLIALNYETIKTKLLNFKALLLGRNPTSPPVTTTSPPVTTTSPPVTTTSPPVTTTSPPVTTTLPAKKIIKVKNVVCADAMTCSGEPASTIVDGNLNSIFQPTSGSSTVSGDKVPYSLIFSFNDRVTINGIIWHSVGNPYYDVDWVEIRNDELTYSGNRIIQTFTIPQLDIPIETFIPLDVNFRKYFDRQIILKLDKPYIGTTMTIRFKNSNMARSTAVREIEFFESTEPSFTTAAPSFTTAAPSFTTAAPSFTTAAPSFTTAAPSFTTAAPSFTTAAPIEKNIKVVDVTCNDRYSCSGWSKSGIVDGNLYSIFPSTIVDGNLNSIFQLTRMGGDASGNIIPYRLVFTFKDRVTINSIIWHSVGNPYWDVDWVEISNDDITYTGNRIIQTFTIPQLDISIDNALPLDVNYRKYFDRQIILKLDKPYIGTTMTIRFKNFSSRSPPAVREIEFFA